MTIVRKGLILWFKSFSNLVKSYFLFSLSLLLHSHQMLFAKGHNPVALVSFLQAYIIAQLIASINIHYNKRSYPHAPFFGSVVSITILNWLCLFF